jgi:hypothetical protein
LGEGREKEEEEREREREREKECESVFRRSLECLQKKKKKTFF